MPFEFHRHQIPLAQDGIIWRYLDLAKYLSLLDTQALFFCRADKFSDPFEGSLPKREVDHRIVDAEEIAHGFGQKFDLAVAQRQSVEMGEWHKRTKRGVLINCWHINTGESDAMWRLYLKDNEGVAIQSSKSRITSAIENTLQNIGMTKVRYLDYENGQWFDPLHYPLIQYNFTTPFVHKRIEFEHEREFRLYFEIPEAANDQDYWKSGIAFPKHENGYFVPINIEQLVAKIILPPTIDFETEQKIIQATIQRGYNFQFERSQLSKPPYF